MSNEITTPASMIELAVKSNADLEKLEKLLELQQRWEVGESKKLYTSAFAKVQEEIASVIKSKKNPITHSQYADLADVIDMSKPCYTKHGFSVIFYEGTSVLQDCVRICADVLHSGGHKEAYHLDMPLDGVGIQGKTMMTRIHGKASAISYARRYLMYMIFNIATADDDGNIATSKPPVQPPQRKSMPTKPAVPETKVSADETFYITMNLLRQTLGNKNFQEILIKNDIKIKTMGEVKRIDPTIREEIIAEMQTFLKGKTK